MNDEIIEKYTFYVDNVFSILRITFGCNFVDIIFNK